MDLSRSTFYSILTIRCPRCHEGKMFPSETLYHPTKFTTMNKTCACCGQSFEPEPGYYYGAMFVSYAINTALFVAVWLALAVLVSEITTTLMVVTLLAVVFGFLPITFRLSRVLWINIFVHYEGLCSEIPRRS